MSKKKRIGEFLDLLEGLSEEELFSLGRIMGVKFGGLEVLDQDEKPLGKTLGELRDELGEEELKKRNYKIRAVKRNPEEIVEDLLVTFYKSSWGQQKDVLEIMKVKKTNGAENVVEDVVENDNCALTINPSILTPEEVQNDGPSTED